MIKVGIVILNFQGAHKTLACLESLKELAGEHIEIKILVVDNGSRDDSIRVIATARPDIEILKAQENLGYAGGNNLGVKHLLTRGIDYIWILNNDVLVKSDTLERMCQVLMSDAKIGCVGCIIRDISNNGCKPLAVGGGRVSWLLGTSRHLDDLSEMHKLDYITGASMLCPKPAWEDAGGLAEEYFLYWEDVDFSLRLQRMGWKLAVATDAEVQHDESSTLGRRSSRMLYYMNRAFVRFALTHSPCPPWTLAAGCSLRILKRILAGKWREALLVWRATLDGWRGRKAAYGEVLNQ